jgi:hypothetical protein
MVNVYIVIIDLIPLRMLIRATRVIGPATFADERSWSMFILEALTSFPLAPPRIHPAKNRRIFSRNTRLK